MTYAAKCSGCLAIYKDADAARKCCETDHFFWQVMEDT